MAFSLLTCTVVMLKEGLGAQPAASKVTSRQLDEGLAKTEFGGLGAWT